MTVKIGTAISLVGVALDRCNGKSVAVGDGGGVVGVGEQPKSERRIRIFKHNDSLFIGARRIIPEPILRNIIAVIIIEDPKSGQTYSLKWRYP
ncbi:MAG: hypothetical protein KAH97_03035 [Anaerolineales bacterium]|nr:hypothetical protein [Anaerolineales bacterium]